MKKKLLFYILVGCMCLSVAACGKKVEKDNSATVPTEESSIFEIRGLFYFYAAF